MYRLGYMYEVGRGIEKDPETSVTWYTRAAHGGSPPAMAALGMAYKAGTGNLVVDLSAYFMWTKLAAEHDEDVAMYRLGSALSSGEGCEANQQQSYDWFTKASAYGDAWKTVTDIAENYRTAIF